MASVYRHTRGGWYAVVTLGSHRRAQIYLGQITKAQANTVARNLDALTASIRVGVPPSQDVADWVSCCDPAFAEKLESLGLLRTCRRSRTCPAVLTYFDQFVARRTDFSASTRKGFQTARHHVAAWFGDRTLDSITVADAKQYARDLAKSCAPSHAKKLVERTAQVFRDAIDAGILTADSFDGIRIAGAADKTRQRYISRDLAMSVLDSLPNTEARALFALARFGGLRVPHEPLALTWDCIDWGRGRIRIPDDTKTGGRIVPMFPEIRAELSGLFEIAPEGSEWVFHRGRASAANVWRSWILDAITKAGAETWPKLFVNLRASCRTDLEDSFPSHVCDAWLGHSTRVAKDHYLQVTPEHWDQAAHGARSTSRRGARRKVARTGSNGGVAKTKKRKNPGK